jgi:hypothetical protein
VAQREASSRQNFQLDLLLLLRRNLRPTVFISTVDGCFAQLSDHIT